MHQKGNIIAAIVTAIKLLENLLHVIYNVNLKFIIPFIQLFKIFSLYRSRDDESQDFYQNNLNFPIYKKLPCLNKMFKTEKDNIVNEIFHTLLLWEKIPKEKICTMVPQQVKQNYTFLVDTNALESPKDILADNCGSWKNDGVRYFYFESTEDSFDSSSSSGVNDAEFRKLGKKVDENILNRPWYKICRKYYRNRDSLDFRRVISHIIGKTY